MKSSIRLFCIIAWTLVPVGLCLTGCGSSNTKPEPNVVIEGPNQASGVVGEQVAIEYTITKNDTGSAPYWYESFHRLSFNFISTDSGIVLDPVNEGTNATVSLSNGEESDLAAATWDGSTYGDFTPELEVGSTAQETTITAYYLCVSPGQAEVMTKVVVQTGENLDNHEGFDEKTTTVNCEITTDTESETESEGSSECEEMAEIEAEYALDLADLMEIHVDEFCDELTDLEIAEIIHSSIDMASKATAGDHTTHDAFVALVEAFAQDLVDQLINNSDFECGEGPNGLTLCPNTITTVSEGHFVVLFSLLMGDIPLDDATNTYQYGFVFDQDGIASNNYAPTGTYANDLFRDTDRWYEAAYTPTAGWSLKVTDATDGVFTTINDSQARIVINSNAMMLLVPASEFAIEKPCFRLTAFRHTGDYGMNPPYNWDGCVWPPVADDLQDFPE